MGKEREKGREIVRERKRKGERGRDWKGKEGRGSYRKTDDRLIRSDREK